MSKFFVNLKLFFAAFQKLFSPVFKTFFQAEHKMIEKQRIDEVVVGTKTPLNSAWSCPLKRILTFVIS